MFMGINGNMFDISTINPGINLDMFTSLACTESSAMDAFVNGVELDGFLVDQFPTCTADVFFIARMVD